MGYNDLPLRINDDGYVVRDTAPAIEYKVACQIVGRKAYSLAMVNLGPRISIAPIESVHCVADAEVIEAIPQAPCSKSRAVSVVWILSLPRLEIAIDPFPSHVALRVVNVVLVLITQHRRVLGHLASFVTVIVREA